MTAIDASKRIRDLVKLLTENVSKQTIKDIKSQLLSIADDIKFLINPIKDNEIDNILSEIDEKNIDEIDDIMTKKNISVEEILAKSIENIMKYTNNEREDTVGYLQQEFNGELTEKTWILLFVKPKHIKPTATGLPEGWSTQLHPKAQTVIGYVNDSTGEKKISKPIDITNYIPIFSTIYKQNNLNENDLSQAWNTIPQKIRNLDTITKYKELAKW
eukprot:225799_1